MLNITKGNHNRFKPDLAPLIDVVFLLLIFYMLTFAVPGHGLDVKLPQGSSSNENINAPLTIKMLPSNEIMVGDKTTELKKLESLLKIEIGRRTNKSVVIYANDKTKYELFTMILDLARLAGANGFSLVM